MKNNPSFNLFIAGQGISNLGTLIQKYCVSLLVLSLTDSPSIFAAVIVLSTLPSIISGPIGGVFADRFDKRKIMIGLDCLSGSILIGYSLLSKNSGQNIISLCIVVFLLSIVSSLYIPAATASIPFMVPKENLVKANSVNTAVLTLTNVAAPIISGFIIGIFDIKWIVLINGLSFLFSAVLEYFICFKSEPPEKQKMSVKAILNDILKGAEYIAGNHQLRIAAVYSMVLNIVIMPFYTIAIPFMSKNSFGFTDIHYGLLESVIMVGLIAGAVVTGLIDIKQKLIPALFGSAFGVGIFFAGLSGVYVLFSREILLYPGNLFAVFSGICLLIGSLISLMSICLTSIIQSSSSRDNIGRINSIIISFSTICIPLGQAVIGYALGKFKVSTILIFLSAMVFIFGVFSSLAVSPRIPQMKKTEIGVE